MGNAIKFTKQGEVALHVENDSETDGDASLLFRVSDTGIGIPPDKLEAIFDSFSQADSSTTREYGGTGLGLAISRRLVEMMGGRLWVESEVGRGSTFHFTAKFEAQAEPQAPDDLSWKSVEGLKTLIVDDNATNRLILKETVGAWGISATEVEDGYMALAELDRARTAGQPYQLLLLDRRMPGMDGFQVADHLKDDLGILDMTIMMLTSDDRTDDIARCAELGVSRYLIKPVKRAALLQAVTAAVGVRRIADGEAGPVAETGVPLDQAALRILLAEDSPDNRLLVQSFLKKTPCEIDVAENGEVALGKFKSSSYDLVLMDMQMPVMDGYSGTRAIREWEVGEDARPTPIIALTANALKEDTQKSLDAGCTAHLTKPIKKARLLEVIGEHSRSVAA